LLCIVGMILKELYEFFAKIIRIWGHVCILMGDNPYTQVKTDLSRTSDVQSQRNVGSPKGREPYGDGVLVVVRARESRVHGEGGQVI
jgi:hypothetical protein